MRAVISEGPREKSRDFEFYAPANCGLLSWVMKALECYRIESWSSSPAPAPISSFAIYDCLQSFRYLASHYAKVPVFWTLN